VTSKRRFASFGREPTTAAARQPVRIKDENEGAPFRRQSTILKAAMGVRLHRQGAGRARLGADASPWQLWVSGDAGVHGWRLA